MSDYMKEMERLVSDLIDAAHGTVMTEDQEREDTARAALLAHAAQRGVQSAALVEVTPEGVQFGGAWFSHERITGVSADDLESGNCALRHRKYMEWVRSQRDHIEDVLDMVPTSNEVMTQASADVLAERQRQIDAEGWTAGYDDDYTSCELASAASCYAGNAGGFVWSAGWPEKIWPWSRAWWKPSTPRRDLVKAGALIIAEIERLDRASRRAMLAAAPAAPEQADHDAPVELPEPRAWEVWWGLGSMRPHGTVFRTKAEADAVAASIKSITEVRPLFGDAREAAGYARGFAAAQKGGE